MGPPNHVYKAKTLRWPEFQPCQLLCVSCLNCPNLNDKEDVGVSVGHSFPSLTWWITSITFCNDLFTWWIEAAATFPSEPHHPSFVQLSIILSWFSEACWGWCWSSPQYLNPSLSDLLISVTLKPCQRSEPAAYTIHPILPGCFKAA